MQESFMELVYLTMQGELIPEYAIANVEDIFAEGGIGIELYTNAKNAYYRVCDRLGVKDEDRDLDEIISNMENLASEMAFRMYQYGAKFGMR